jgi:serine/threonine protein kinase
MMALQRGDVVDRYRLEEPLGAGAFGEVWKANQLANGEPIGITCALKVMRLVHDRVGSSPRGLPTGWLDEAQYLVRVAGRTVPRIHEANVWKGHAYIAMELLDGVTLRTKLSHGPVPWRRALFIADQIATALEAAHQIGLIHRDLKPQNVMLVDAQRCCVLDWGIARLHTSAMHVESGLERQLTEDIETTDAISVPVIAHHPQRMPVGTPGYMAPEVYDGAHPAPAQDAYSLGVVLYEMIAGCLPHALNPVQRTRATPDSMKVYRVSLDRATMDHLLIPLRERCPGVPVAVAELVDTLLACDPEQRPTKLRAAIEHASRFSHGIPDPPYVGLSTLGLQHAGLYFGQRDAIQGILNHLTSQRAALLWGPSGSGKSSLALAGVAATMDRTLFLGMDGWEVHVVRPREGKAFRVVPGAASSPRPAIGQVIVLDQLEEVVDLEPAARDVFCGALLALLERSAPVVVRDITIGSGDEVRVIATIRDDLEWWVDREVPALRPLLDRRIIVKGIDVNLARNIIEEPARALDYEVEGIAAVTREVQERLSAEPAKLPVVQYALSEWWERRDREHKILPLAAWNELGGVDGALSFVAERFFSALDQELQQRVKTLFVRLFRGRRKQPLVESGLDDGDRFVMEELGRLRLVGRHVKKGSEPFYEVEHEYLAANWARLAGWLAEARDDRALVDELERDAAAYLRDQDPERLWRKGRLAAATEMAGQGRIVLDENTAEFLRLARRRERRGRLVLRAAIGIALAVILGVVYVVVLQAAASKAHKQAGIELERAKSERERAESERQRAESERQRAEVAHRRASQLEVSAMETLEHAKQQGDQQIKNAEQEAARIDEGVARRVKAANEEVERAKQWAQAERNAAIKSRQEQEKRTVVLKALAESAIKNASAAAKRAQEAEQGARAAEQRQRAICGAGADCLER